MKKLSKLFEEMINEGASEILYHFTYSSRLSNILSTNKLYLTSTMGSKVEFTKDKLYFMSFTRTKSTKSGYGTKFQRPGSIRIKVDGRRLGQNYKVIPVDYWQYPRTPEIMKQGNHDEMEDRVVSDKNEIPNANKYIISIDIYDDGESVTKEMIQDAKNLGITLYFFNNIRDFEAGDPKRSIKPTIYDGGEKSSSRSFINDIIGMVTYKDPELTQKMLTDFKEKFNMSDEDIEGYKKVMSYEHDKLKDRLHPSMDYRVTDVNNSLSASLHNNKSNSNPLVRYVINQFAIDYKKNSSKSLKDYLEYKMYIGSKRQSDYKEEFKNNINEKLKESVKEALGNLDFQVYDKDWNSIESLAKYPPLVNYFKDKTRLILQYISNYIDNNDNMFKDYYHLSRSEINNNIDLKSGSDEAIVGLQDVDPSELEDTLNRALWVIDDYVYDEVDRMRTEYFSQKY